MKRIKFTIVITLLISLVSYSQDTPELTYFNGGNMSIDIRLSSNFFGGGGGSGASGGIISPLMNNYSSAIFSNPAELSFLKGPYAQFDYKAGIALNNFIDHSQIESATDDYLNDTTMFIYEGENTEYTNVTSSRAGQLGGFSAFSFAFPIAEKFYAAFGYNYPFQFQMDMNVTGLETDLHTSEDVGGNETTFDMLLTTTVENNINIAMSEITFGFGAELYNGENGYLSAGITVSKFEVSNYVNMLTQIDGAIVLNNSNEYYFNDPDDILLDKEAGETNDFYWKVKGNYQDTRYGGKFGIYYNLREDRASRWNFSLLYDFRPDFSLYDAGAVNVGYQPKFMTGRLLGEGDEALDIDLDSVNLSKPHLTKATENFFTDKVILEMPSSLTFGVDAQLGKTALAFNFTKYFGKFFYKFDRYEIGKETSVGVKLAADFRFDDKLEGWGYAAIPIRLLFLDVDGLLFQIFGETTGYRNPHYRIAAGAIFGNDIESDFGEDYNDMLQTALSLPYPYGLSLSRQYTILDHLNVGVMIFGFPDLALKFSLGYGF